MPTPRTLGKPDPNFLEQLFEPTNVQEQTKKAKKLAVGQRADVDETSNRSTKTGRKKRSVQ